MSQSTSRTVEEFRDSAEGRSGDVFEVLTLPPRLVAQAVDDLHTLAKIPGL